MTESTPHIPDDPGPGLRELLREDWETHHRRLAHPGFHAVAVHHIGVWARQQGWLVRKVVGALYVLVNTFVICNLYGIEISRTTTIGRRLCIAHHQAIVIGDSVVLGDDCLIRQGVTLGQAVFRPLEQPVVGNGVHFGAGAMVLGSVRIGDGARIGPGSIITRSVPAGATTFAAPARMILPGAAGPIERT